VSGTDLKESAGSSRRSSSFNNPSGTAPTSGSPSRRSSSNVSLRSRSGSRKASISKNGLSGILLGHYLNIKPASFKTFMLSFECMK